MTWCWTKLRSSGRAASTLSGPSPAPSPVPFLSQFLSEPRGLAFVHPFLTVLCHSRVYSVSCKDPCSSLTAGSSWGWLSLIPEGWSCTVTFLYRVSLSAPEGDLKDVQWKSKGDRLSLARGCSPLRPSGARRALFCETCTPESADKLVHINRTLTEFPGLCGECIIFKTPSLPQRVVWSPYRGQAALKLFTASVYPVAAGTVLGDDYPKLRIES